MVQRLKLNGIMFVLATVSLFGLNYTIEINLIPLIAILGSLFAAVSLMELNKNYREFRDKMGVIEVE